MTRRNTTDDKKNWSIAWNQGTFQSQQAGSRWASSFCSREWVCVIYTSPILQFRAALVSRQLCGSSLSFLLLALLLTCSSWLCLTRRPLRTALVSACVKPSCFNNHHGLSWSFWVVAAYVWLFNMALKGTVHLKIKIVIIYSASCHSKLFFYLSKGHWHTLSPKFSHAFFRIPHPFRSKCMQRMRKRRKSNLIRIFLTVESFGGSVQTWLTQREVVFIFNVRKFRTKI